MLGNRRYCYALTITDHASRYLLTCEALSSTGEDFAFTVFERLFKERGLPANIRSDNGVPFAPAPPYAQEWLQENLVRTKATIRRRDASRR